MAPVANVVRKPANMTFAHAAGLGIATVTGVRVVDDTQVAKGQRVLITGVAGGVGSAAAQTAKAKGAIVVGTASAQHNAYLSSIGVDQVIDYTKVEFEEQVGHVDVVIDTVGGDTSVRNHENAAPRRLVPISTGNLRPRRAVRSGGLEVCSL